MAFTMAVRAGRQWQAHEAPHPPLAVPESAVAVLVALALASDALAVLAGALLPDPLKSVAYQPEPLS
jgi:hypothetical protein